MRSLYPRRRKRKRKKNASRGSITSIIMTFLLDVESLDFSPSFFKELKKRIRGFAACEELHSLDWAIASQEWDAVARAFGIHGGGFFGECERNKKKSAETF